MTETKRPEHHDLPTLQRDAVRRLEQLGAALAIVERHIRDHSGKYAAHLLDQARGITLAAALLDEGVVTAERLTRAIEVLRFFGRIELPLRGLAMPDLRDAIDHVSCSVDEASESIDRLTDALLDVRAMRRLEQGVERRLGLKSEEFVDETAKHVRALSSFEADAAGLIVAVMSDGEILIAKDRAGTYPARVTFEQLLKRLEHHVVIQDIEKGEPLSAQIERLANWILHNAPETITEGGAVDCAIRALATNKDRMAWLEADTSRLEDVRGHINNTDACSIANAIDALRTRNA